jgi:hypothetical protein
MLPIPPCSPAWLNLTCSSWIADARPHFHTPFPGLLEILDDRYGRVSTLVASQVPVPDSFVRFSDPTLGDGNISGPRVLRHRTTHSSLPSSSVRPAQKATGWPRANVLHTRAVQHGLISDVGNDDESEFPPAGKDLMAIMQEDGVSDLKGLYGLGCVAAFAKALFIERQAGHTAPEALEQLDKALDLEHLHRFGQHDRLAIWMEYQNQAAGSGEEIQDQGPQYQGSGQRDQTGHRGERPRPRPLQGRGPLQ